MRSGLCPVLVQRDDELAALESALMAAQRGDPGFAVLSGEAGIGKTRLAIELARRARQLGCEVLAGSCSEAELSLPYLPFVEALGNYIDANDLAALAERLGPSRRELAQLFPQLADGGPPAQEGNAEQAKLRLFEAISGCSPSPPKRAALLLVVEDVHWADDSTRELLDHLARRLAGCVRSCSSPSAATSSIAAIRSFRRCRDGGVRAWPRYGAGAAARGGGWRDARGDHRCRRGGRELRELITERTEGNPFVLEEMLQRDGRGGDAAGA